MIWMLDSWTLNASLAETIVGQLVTLAKGPLDILRGHGQPEKLLKNAKDECAAEALEIATYDAIEALAEALNDTETAELARAIRKDEERMLADLRALIPSLTGVTVAQRTPVANYDELNAGQVAARLGDLSQSDLATVLPRIEAQQLRKCICLGDASGVINHAAHSGAEGLSSGSTRTSSSSPR